jgi:hypothetical protein
VAVSASGLVYQELEPASFAVRPAVKKTRELETIPVPGPRLASDARQLFPSPGRLISPNDAALEIDFLQSPQSHCLKLRDRRVILARPDIIVAALVAPEFNIIDLNVATDFLHLRRQVEMHCLAAAALCPQVSAVPRRVGKRVRSLSLWPIWFGHENEIGTLTGGSQRVS